MCVAGVIAARGADNPHAGVAEKLKPIPACPSAITAATLNKIPLQGSSSASPGRVDPGDSATVLVTFVQKEKQTQWLLHLEATAPDPARQTNKPSKFVVNSAFGPPMTFESKPTPMRLRMLGPFGAKGFAKPLKSEDRTESFFVNEDFLALGLDQSAALLYRWGQTTNFAGEVTSKALLAMNPTPAEQRAINATFPALLSYFHIVQHTKGLESLLRKLVEFPSLWSIIRHGGVTADLSFGNGNLPWPAVASDWSLPAQAAAYHFPWLLRLNHEPAMKITLVVTQPKPPLLVCGGVVGLLAERIDDDLTYMTMRLVSATRAAKE